MLQLCFCLKVTVALAKTCVKKNNKGRKKNHCLKLNIISAIFVVVVVVGLHKTEMLKKQQQLLQNVYIPLYGVRYNPIMENY